LSGFFRRQWSFHNGYCAAIPIPDLLFICPFDLAFQNPEYSFPMRKPNLFRDHRLFTSPLIYNSHCLLNQISLEGYGKTKVRRFVSPSSPAFSGKFITIRKKDGNREK
jgi:hypothetical protein